MKKILSLITTLLAALSLIACTSNGGETTTKKTLQTGTTAAEKETRTKADTSKVDALEFTEGDEYDIAFWHPWGQEKTSVLQTLIDEFAAYMKDTYDVKINVTLTNQSDYGTLLEKTNKAIAAGDKSSMPNLVMGYPDHFAGYINSYAVVSMDPYIDSDIWGINRDDIIKSYMDENNQFGGITYSLPLAKSTEIMLYNKSALDLAGVTIPYETAITWQELFNKWDTVKAYVSDTTKNTIYSDFKYMIGYDSTDNMFINFARQLNAKYTNSKGELLAGDQSTITMVTYLEQCFQKNWLSVPINYSDTANYCSNYFKQQMVPITIGSTAGVSYNIPTAISETDGIKYVFEVCAAQMPQSAVGVDGEAGTPSATQQGPNVAILNAGDDYETLVSWLLVKYLTCSNQYIANDDAKGIEGHFVEGQNNSARLALGTQYFPVTYSSYNSSLYQDYMKIGKAYYENGYTIKGIEDQFTEKEIANLVYSEIAYMAYLQTETLKYDPAFAATSTLYGSATIRTNAGDYVIAKIAKNPTLDATTVLEEFIKACTVAGN